MISPMTGSDMPALLKALAGARIGADERKKKQTEGEVYEVEHFFFPPLIRGVNCCVLASRELRERDCSR